MLHKPAAVFFINQACSMQSSRMLADRFRIGANIPDDIFERDTVAFGDRK